MFKICPFISLWESCRFATAAHDSHRRRLCVVNATFLGKSPRFVRCHRCKVTSRVRQLGWRGWGTMYYLQAVARIAVLSAVGVLCACSIFPTSGPASSDVRNEKPDPQRLPYALVRVTPEVEKVLERKAPRIAQVFPDRGGPGEIRFGIGDVVSVTVFESAAGGLFIPLEAGVRPGPRGTACIVDQRARGCGNAIPISRECER